ncbi:hypothetical protein [Pseudomonas amygdali]|nr:hypothetical protein [Pseudomonas amygdali]
MSNEFKLVPVEPTDEMVSAVLDLGRIDPDDVAYHEQRIQAGAG